jgi:ribosomal protein S18 acetylase RimI-like enzyme
VHDIRRPVTSDAVGMGRVVVRAWQAAYRSIMPDEYLDALSPADRASMWRHQIDATGGDGLFVATADGQVVGFSASGRSQDESAPDEGQVYAINVDPDHWGKGLGRALLQAATDELVHQGFKDLVLWVVPGNTRARGLYESEDWRTDGTSRDEDVFGVAVTVLQYRRPASSSDPASSAVAPPHAR